MTAKTPLRTLTRPLLILPEAVVGFLARAALPRRTDEVARGGLRQSQTLVRGTGFWAWGVGGMGDYCRTARVIARWQVKGTSHHTRATAVEQDGVNAGGWVAKCLQPADCMLAIQGFRSRSDLPDDSIWMCCPNGRSPSTLHQRNLGGGGGDRLHRAHPIMQIDFAYFILPCPQCVSETPDYPIHRPV